MIGRRAASGSVAIRLRKVVIACSASSRSASMFTSSRFAPPRTCSSATATPPWKSSASTSRRNFAEPVTFVRSPTMTKPVSGPTMNGSRPEKRGSREGSGTWRGGSPSTARRDLARVLRRRPAAAADEIDETVLGECTQEPARIPRLLVVEPERVRQACVRVAGDVGRGDVGEPLEERPHLRRAERAVHSDDERLRVLDRNPERVRRLAGQVAPAPVHGGEREPERDLGRDVTGRDDRRLGVRACRRSSRP